MTTETERVAQLRKAAEQKAPTRSQLQPWQENLSRNTTVPPSAQVSAEAITGMSGGWAAFVDAGLGVSLNSSLGRISTPETKILKVGSPGLPEINFPPYNYGSNRFGSKGPSLIGHPISMSVVGPTLKSPYTTWQWEVTDNSGSPGVGDEIHIDAVDSALSTSVLSVPPLSTSVPSIYNLALGAPTILFLVVSQTGAVGEAPAMNSGLSDGFIGDGGGLGKVGANPLKPTSKYEIFRIEEVLATGFKLDPNKRLKDHFDLLVGTHFRAVTVFIPYATRLVAVPGSGVRGREKTFVVTYPELTCADDAAPPYDTGAPGDGSWVRGGFDTNDASSVGDTTTYSHRVRTPVPRPLEYRQGRAQRTSDPAVSAVSGRMIIKSVGTTVSASDVSKVLRVYHVDRIGDAPFGIVASSEGDKTTEDAFLGWYYISSVNVPNNYYTVSRVPEFDPATGAVFWGSYKSLQIDDSVVPGDLVMHFTMHDSVYNMHRASQLDLDKLESARLQHLIDPTWVKRSARTSAGMTGTSAARPDRAVCDTRLGADPGSLMDLGFRMVLFPAKDPGTGRISPDWDYPIDAREVVLDPAVTEQQYLDIDYSAGTVTFSHTPVPGPGCTVAPNGIISVENPRGEIVLFACCVPTSMEEGQRGAGFRVLASSTSGEPCGAEWIPADIYGRREVASLAENVNGSAQTVTSGVGVSIYLDTVYPDIPETGFVELRAGGPLGAPAIVGPGSEPLGLFGYTRKETYFDPVLGADITHLRGCYGGGLYGVDTVSAVGVVAVLRRDVRTPVDADGVAGTHYEHDTTYGFAKRTTALRFRDFELTPMVDGSVLARSTSADNVDALARDFFSSVVIRGGEVVPQAGFFYRIEDAEVLISGTRYVLTPGPQAALPALSTRYIYFDSTGDCPTPAVAASLPLPNQEDVLLARVDTDGVGIINVIDLRHPLRDVDLRVDVLVGEYAGATDLPHYATLAEAVAFVGEMMAPGSGTPSRSWRILVVGNTVETAVPIVMPTGLTIEGIRPWVNSKIQWSTDTALFQLNGQSNLVFRNLFFEYTGVGSLATPDRVVFQATNASSAQLEIDRCALLGATAHGLVRVSVGAGLNDGIIQNCIANGSDFGVYAEDGMNRMTIKNNLFQGALVPQTPLKLGMIHVGSFSERITITDNTLYNPYIGIRFEGKNSLIARNFTSRTHEMAIYLVNGDENVIRHNILRNTTHLDAPTILPVKTGIAIPSTSTGIRNLVEGNQVVLSAPGASDRGIYLANVDAEHTVTRNFSPHGIYVRGGAWVRDNYVNDSLIQVAGDSTLVESNTALIVYYVGDSGQILGNRASLGIAYDGQAATVMRNECSGQQGLIGPGSSIAVKVTSAGVASADSKVGFNICTNEIDLAVDDGEVIGNTASDLWLEGSRTILGDNNISGDILVQTSVWTVTTAADTVQHNQVGGDILVYGDGHRVLSNRVPTGGIGSDGDGPHVEGNDVGATQSTIGGAARSIAIIQDADTNDISDSPLVSDNKVYASILVRGALATVQGNNHDPSGSGFLEFYGFSSVVSGNLNTTRLRVLNYGSPSYQVTITGNHVLTQMELTDSTDCIVTGNHVGTNLSSTGGADNTVVSGNRVAGNCTLVGDYQVVDGNKIDGTLTVTGTGNIVTDNEPTTVTVTGGTDHVVKGNKCTSLSVVANGSAIHGNIMSGELTVVGTTPSAGAAGATVFGNTCNSIDHQAANCILVGNRVLAADLGGGRIAIRSSLNGDARPSGTILVGNMLGDSTGGSIIVYTSANWLSDNNDNNQRGT